MLDKNKLDWIYNKLFTIRFFEERIKKIAKEKSVPGYLHTCIAVSYTHLTLPTKRIV